MRRMKRRHLIAAGLGYGLALGIGCARRQPAIAPTAQDAYRRPQIVLAALSLRPGQQVAEIGAGGGYLTRYLAAAVGPKGRVVATDIDDEALAALALRCRDEGLTQVLPRRVAADDPGLEVGAFDLILLSHVDHLLPDRVAYLRRLPTALRPRKSGRIVVCNREAHRAGLLAAAVDAGLTVEPPLPPPDLPGQYLLTLRPGPSAP
jgi:predicted methyltransferase